VHTIQAFLDKAARLSRMAFAADAHPDPENFHAYVAEATWRHRSGYFSGED
jgi:hypothetical protein